MEAFINRFRAQASKAALVQSKIKTLERMGRKEELSDEEALDFRFCEAENPAKLAAEVKNLSFHYPDGPALIKDLSILIGRRDRIGVIGKNGKGKSTLLRLLSGELHPSAGEITLNKHARLGYFGQTNIQRLNPKHTVEEEIGHANHTLHRTKIRAICGTMMFGGDDALKKISVLSGGEKSRVLLGRILAQPTNLLLLDEPTNHLDMESIEALIESLKSYEGALVIVTHSELILRELATKLVIFQGETPTLFNHDYEYFLQKEGWGDEQSMSSSSTSVKKVEPARAPKPKPQSKVLAALERKIKNIEDKICELEEKCRKQEEALAAAYQSGDLEDGEALVATLAALKITIEKKFEELELLSKEYETLK